MPAVPTAQNVADFLGRGGEVRLVALAEEHLPLVVAFVKGYTRGRGFTGADVAEDLAAVIVTATARLVTNPAQVNREAADGYEAVGSFNGWSLPELAVLHRYRVRTA